MSRRFHTINGIYNCDDCKRLATVSHYLMIDKFHFYRNREAILRKTQQAITDDAYSRGIFQGISIYSNEDYAEMRINERRASLLRRFIRRAHGTNRRGQLI